MAAADEIFGTPAKKPRVDGNGVNLDDPNLFSGYVANDRGSAGFGDARDLGPNQAQMGVFFDPSAKEGDRTGFYNDFLREDLRAHPGGQQVSLQQAGITPGSAGDPTWSPPGGGSLPGLTGGYDRARTWGSDGTDAATGRQLDQGSFGAAPDDQAPGPAAPAAGPTAPSNFMGGGSGAGGFAGGAGQAGGDSNYGGWRKRHAHQFGGDSPAGQIFGKGPF